MVVAIIVAVMLYFGVGGCVLLSTKLANPDRPLHPGEIMAYIIIGIIALAGDGLTAPMARR